MATKTICDKCKKEIVENRSNLLLRPFNDIAKDYDLCQNCYLTLKAKLSEYLP